MISNQIEEEFSWSHKASCTLPCNNKLSGKLHAFNRVEFPQYHCWEMGFVSSHSCLEWAGCNIHPNRSSAVKENSRYVRRCPRGKNICIEAHCLPFFSVNPCIVAISNPFRLQAGMTQLGSEEDGWVLGPSYLCFSSLHHGGSHHQQSRKSAGRILWLPGPVPAHNP